MEKTIMRITGLQIKKLHNHINYDVKINDNITFLYGDNGCGKTTILNIMTSIITGKIFELFKYDFEEITLNYVSSRDKKQNKIVISYMENENMHVYFMGTFARIDGQHYKYMNRNLEEIESVERFYFSEYPILKKINETFNYAYLPLNRNGTVMSEPYNMRHRRRHSNYIQTHNDFSNSIDLTLLDVQALVSSAYNKENFTLKRISEKFNNDILKSFLDIENVSNTDQVINYMNSLNEKSIKKIQTDYKMALRTINQWSDSSERGIDSYFESLIDDIKEAKQDVNYLTVQLLFKLSELTKITNIIKKAESTEQSKTKAKQPIENFLNTVNSFICNNNGKEIKMEYDGTLYLMTEYNKKIDINNLSSGEKQIITFFAYLIFGLETTNQSIFIVDEPELSLHLSWQRKFIDAIMSINKNVQLIFATHAPEIIGKHRDKAVKLIPNV